MNDPNPIIDSTDPVLTEARKRFDRCNEWEGEWRSRYLEDVKFANGDSQNGYQWPDEIRTARENKSRPCLTMNLIQAHNKMISNEARKNKAEVRFVGMGNGATQDCANVYQDLYRHIEYQSNAQYAYTKASGFAVEGGMGYWRLVNRYIGDDTFDQDIYIEAIDDPLQVFLDPDIKVGGDGSDARFAFIFDDVPRDEMEEAYPDLYPLMGESPLGVGGMYGNWADKGHLRVCEYFRCVPNKQRLYSFVHGGQRHTIREDVLERLVQRREARERIISDPQTRVRTVVKQKVEWKLIVGLQVVDETDWIGDRIPIIRCPGEETVIEGRMDRKGHTRWMLDAQRMFNVNAPLALSTPIPTPIGWTTMGDLNKGDEVLDENGKSVTVEGTSPVFENRKCYEISFDNDTKIIADAEHLWTVEERGIRTSAGETWYDTTIKTKELSSKMHFICSPKALDLPFDKELPVHPYVLGLWLGDGNSRDARLTCHKDDAEETKTHIQNCGHQVGDIHYTEANSTGVFTIFGIRHLLAQNNLKEDKHIPIQYLRASCEQRFALLQGLMDSDGHVNDAHQCIFVNTNTELISGIRELLHSLGIKSTVRGVQGARKIFPSGKTYESKSSLRVHFTANPDEQVFKLWRKRLKQEAPRSTHWRRTKRIGIVSIREVSSVPVKCIVVDSKSHLFLAGNGMVPTHNSAQVEVTATQTKSPWLAPAKSIEEYESMWNNANIENRSVLIFNHVDSESDPAVPIPPPQRIDPPQLSPAYQQGMENARQQIMMVSGQYENQMGEQGNERTGAAINARRQQSSTANFHFQDNYEMALVNTGKQILQILPLLYDTKRIKNVLGNDGIEYALEIDPGLREGYLEQQDAQGKVVKRCLNPLIGKYDVAARVGPAQDTRREETIQALGVLLTQAPGLTGLVGDIMLRNMNWDGAQEAALRLRRMVPPVALGQGPTQNEQQMQAQITALQQALTKSLDKVAKDGLKLAGKDELRDIEVYDAETKRIAALSQMLPTDPEGLKTLIGQLVQDAMNESLSGVKAQVDKDQGADDVTVQAEAGGESHPVPGAQKAPDGEWYLQDPTRRGKYLHIAPLSSMHKTPGQGLSVPQGAS